MAVQSLCTFSQAARELEVDQRVVAVLVKAHGIPMVFDTPKHKLIDRDAVEQLRELTRRFREPAAASA